MKKTLLLIIFAVVLTSTHVTFARSSDYKDNVLISMDNRLDIGRGYDLLWKAENITGTYPQESAVIKKDDIVYITSLNLTSSTEGNYPGNNKIFALDADTGVLIDEVEIGPSFGDAHIDGNNFYVSTGDEFWNGDTEWTGDFGIYSFDISDVRNNGLIQNWFKSVPTGVGAKLLVDNNNIYFVEFFETSWGLGNGNQVRAVDKNTGNDIWSFTKGVGSAVYPLLKDGFMYVTNSYGGGNTMYKLDVLDGSQVWEQPIVGKLWDNSITYSPEQNALYLTAYYDKDYYSYDHATATASGHSRAVSYDMNGVERWSQDLHDLSLSYTSYHDNSVFFADLSGWVYSFNADTGALEWEAQIGKEGHKVVDIASPVIANGYVFVGTKGEGYPIDSVGRGAFYILDEETGEVVWTYQEDDLGDVMALATVADGTFYNVTNAWDVYAFDIGDGTTSDHLNSTYDDNNTFSTETGLTQDRYAELNCYRFGPGGVARCRLDNNYNGNVINAKVDFKNENDILFVLENDIENIYIENGIFHPFEVSAQDTSSNIIVAFNSGGLNHRGPRLSNVSFDSAKVSSASRDGNNVVIKTKLGDNFSAKVNSFIRPFVGAETKIFDNNVTFSKSRLDIQADEIISADMEITKENLEDGFINVSVSNWNQAYMNWKETLFDTESGFTFHKVNQLKTNRKYLLQVENEDGERYEQVYISNRDGVIEFKIELDTNKTKSVTLTFA